MAVTLAVCLPPHAFGVQFSFHYIMLPSFLPSSLFLSFPSPTTTQQRNHHHNTYCLPRVCYCFLCRGFTSLSCSITFPFSFLPFVTNQPTLLHPHPITRWQEPKKLHSGPTRAQVILHPRRKLLQFTPKPPPT
ncbi:hypothetical protein HOY80DRAFT_535850 [Tuber brumale]|nr:hypothetical protein HOY80DRAFT_535850 [Tuber brumale]